MKVSEAWLREWVDPDASSEDLCHQLTRAGLEVDATEPAAPGFEGVVVGEVLAVEPHPDADKLRVCQVDVGAPDALQIVCGAPTVMTGMRVPTALVGARLPNDLKIKKAKLRGVQSFGMLCSAVEIGLAEQSDGLLPLPADLAVGMDIRAALQLDDNCIELGLTPNRGDCLGIAGVAREVGVLYRAAVNGPSMDEVPATTQRVFDIEVTAPAACPHYVGRVIENVDVNARTPLWMQERLRRCGLRSLGPVVDVTNYVLLELGQPMHGFDLDWLSGKIEVRYAQTGEKLALLDGSKIEPDTDTLVIADASGPLALAGIMGGADSAVSGATRNIFLESAYFSPTTIAGKARSYGLHTDSSHRFERGVSPQLQRTAIERATRLLLDIAGGEPGPIVERSAAAELPSRPDIVLRAGRLQRVLGMDVPAAEVSEILERLGMSVTASDDSWKVVPPPYRFDIAIEEDLIEEVGRIHGYDKLPARMSYGGLSIRPQVESDVPVDRMADLLVDRGYHEAITYSFVDPQLQAIIAPGQDTVALANPISADLSVMRTSLWPGLIQALQYNRNRQQERVRLFESGLRFVPDGKQTQQDQMLAAVVVGQTVAEQWGERGRPVDFHDVKGDVEAILALNSVAGEFMFEAALHPALHPGQSARILRNGTEVGWLGMLDPRAETALDVAGPVGLFELRVAAISTGAVPEFEPLSRFPSIRRDLSLTVDEGVAADAIIDCVRGVGSEAIKDIRIFDVYTGEGVDSGRKSVALGLILQESSRTLKDEEVDAIVAGIVVALREELGANLRE